MSEAWTEVRVRVPRGWHELAGDVLVRETGTSVAFGSPGLGVGEPPAELELVRGFLAARDDTPATRARIDAALAGLAAATGAGELRGLAAEYLALPPEDWATSWRKAWKPFRVGRVAVVQPLREGSRAGPARAGDVRIEFEPQSAFGSGRHATTRACLRLLQELVRGGERVLDAGTGSGLLAVAAVRLGARSALGFDVDPSSPPGAGALAAANGVASSCEFRLGDFGVLGPGDVDFDLALANIYADVVAAHAGELRERLRAGGTLVTSGISSDKVAWVRAALGAAGLRLERELARGRWRTLIATRPAEPRSAPRS